MNSSNCPLPTICSSSSTPSSSSAIPRKSRHHIHNDRKAGQASRTVYPKSWTRRPLWEQGFSSDSDSSTDDDEDDAQDDYAWYYNHPERYVWRPRKTRKAAFSAAGARASRSLHLNESDHEEMDNSSSSSSSSSSDSELSSIECLTPATPQDSFGAAIQVRDTDEKRWSLISSSSSLERGSFGTREWVTRWRLSSLRVPC